MNWKTILRPVLAFLLRYLRDRFVDLSKADGNDGLTVGDFQAVVGKVKEIAKTYKKTSGLTKAKAVAEWAKTEFGPKVDEYVIPVLVSKAYEYADRTGLLK